MPSLHIPNLNTVLMVERTLREHHEPMRKMQLWKALPKSTEYPTFTYILGYLESHNLITFDNKGMIVWIAADNPKLREMLRTGVRLLD